MNTHKCAALFNSIYDRKVTSAYFEWQLDNPDACWVSIEGQDTLKAIGGIHFLNIGICKVGLLVDVMIDKQYRNKGRTFVQLVKKLEMEALSGGAKALIMLPNAQGAHAWGADKDWLHLKDITTHTCPTCQRLERELPAYEIHNIKTWLPPLDEIFRLSQPALFIMRRTFPYMGWRLKNPMYGYTPICTRHHGARFGYLLLKQFNSYTGDIVDMLWAQDDIGAIKSMLCLALDRFHRLGLKQAAVWLPPYTTLFEAAWHVGFRPTADIRGFYIKILDSKFDYLADASRWFTTMLSSEVF